MTQTAEGLRADVLARLLLIQTTASQLPEDSAILAFVCRGLKQVPGVAKAWHVGATTHNETEANLEPPLQRFPVRLGMQNHGHIVIRLSDGPEFLPYAAHITNLAFMVAVMLEERRHRRLAETYQRELEARVEERTRQLSAEIRDRKAAESAALLEKRRAESYLEVSEALIVELGEDARVVLINKRGCDLLGWSPRDILGRDWLAIAVEPAARSAVKFAFQTALEGQNAYHDNDVLTRSGERRHIAWHTTVRRDDQGTAVGVVCSGIDITERNRAEEALRISEERYRQVSFVMSDIVYSCSSLQDGSVAIDWIGGAVERITGYGIEEIKSMRTWSELVLDEDRTNFRERVETLKPGTSAACEVRFRHKDGTIHWISSSAACVLSPTNPHAPRIYGALVDINDRKRAEGEHKQLQDQLHQAMKMEAVGRLAGGIAHDFNNLLTGITGHVSLALLDLDPQNPLTETLNDVNAAAMRAAGLTTQLLAFSRKQLIQPKVINLNDTITGLHRMLVRLIGEDITLKTLPATNLGAVEVDPGQMEQVLVNLVVNARDAMPDGGTLIIETANVKLDEDYCARHAETRPGAFVMMAVSDTGCGMTDEVKKHVFEPFFTTKPTGRGTGLGLATIYGAIKQAGGSVDIYSELGRGTSVKVYLPRVEQPPVGQVLGTHSPQLPKGKETVLLVEDEEIVRHTTMRFLKRLGYQVIVAANGAEALEIALGIDAPIDLLLTDVVMPGMNGRQLAERLTPTRPNMKVLYTSGYTEDAIAHHGVIDEGLHFVGKPCPPQKLAQTIRSLLDGKPLPKVERYAVR